MPRTTYYCILWPEQSPVLLVTMSQYFLVVLHIGTISLYCCVSTVSCSALLMPSSCIVWVSSVKHFVCRGFLKYFRFLVFDCLLTFFTNLTSSAKLGSDWQHCKQKNIQTFSTRIREQQYGHMYASKPTFRGHNFTSIYYKIAIVWATILGVDTRDPVYKISYDLSSVYRKIDLR